MSGISMDQYGMHEKAAASNSSGAAIAGKQSGLGSAVDRMARMCGALADLNGYAGNHADRCLGGQPETPNKTEEPGLPAGTVAQLHFLLDKAESLTGAIHRQLERLEDV